MVTSKSLALLNEPGQRAGCFNGSGSGSKLRGIEALHAALATRNTQHPRQPVTRSSAGPRRSRAGTRIYLELDLAVRHVTDAPNRCALCKGCLQKYPAPGECQLSCNAKGSPSHILPIALATRASRVAQKRPSCPAGANPVADTLLIYRLNFESTVGDGVHCRCGRPYRQPPHLKACCAPPTMLSTSWAQCCLTSASISPRCRPRYAVERPIVTTPVHYQ